MAEVRWSEHVLGHFEQRGRQTALAVISSDDLELGGEVAVLRGLGSPPSVVLQECADRLGRPLTVASALLE